MTMTNTAVVAARWSEFISTRPEFPAGNRLRAAFAAGKLTRLCDCGCNAFDLQVPESSTVQPIARSGGYGSVFEISFEVSQPQSVERQSLEFIVFADKRGHFAGIEVDFCGNSFPVPEHLLIHEPPYHVRCSPEIDA